MRIVLDAVGGDIGVSVNIEGAIIAARQLNPDDEIILIGDSSEIEHYLKSHNRKLNFPHRIIDTKNNVSMSDSPVKALSERSDSSISKGMDLVKSGEADAFYSAGNTGVILAFALVKVGRIKGVIRPALSTIFPAGRQALFLDVGATPDCKGENLYQFAVLGSEYVKIIKGIKEPIVGLMSNGEESSKGNLVTQKAFELIKNDPNIKFYGNVEGHDLFSDKVDVVVCDGFTGNIVLKFGEGMTHWLKDSIKNAVRPMILAVLGIILTLPGFLGIPFFLTAVKKILKKVSYDEYGGAPLLGVDGVILIGHGKSNKKAIANGILNAKKLVENDFAGKIKKYFTERSGNEAV